MQLPSVPEHTLAPGTHYVSDGMGEGNHDVGDSSFCFLIEERVPSSTKMSPEMQREILIDNNTTKTAGVDWWLLFILSYL